MMPANELFALIRWWAALALIGAAALPLAWRLFHKLPDRGFAFARLVGLLLVGYLFWIGASLGALGNNLGGVVFALAATMALSWRALRGESSQFRVWLRENRGYILGVEGLFALILIGWALVRAQNPAISGTEKPMEFAFLNSVSRSPAYPPLDPWLSGFAISYYYFGYVMVSVISRLAAVDELFAFNLGIAWLAAATATASFGLIYNLIMADAGIFSASAKQRAIALAFIGALALPIAGNQEIFLEILHGNGVGSDAFWRNLDVAEISGPATDSPRYDGGGWWWWRASRVIAEYDFAGVRAGNGSPVHEPIAEFPGFSFILGDMHPHVLALPYAMLAMAVAFAWWLEDDDEADVEGDFRRLAGGAFRRPLFWFALLALGGLSFLNTWDVLIYLFLFVGMMVLRAWRKTGEWHAEFVAAGIKRALMLALPAIVLYLPFYIGFRSQAGAPYLLPFLMRPTRLVHFLIIFAMPLFTIALLLMAEGFRNRFSHWKKGLGAALALLAGLHLAMFFLGWVVASSPQGAGQVGALAEALNITLPAQLDPSVGGRVSWGFRAVARLAPAILARRFALPGLILLLSALLGLTVMAAAAILNRPAEQNRAERGESKPSPALPFVLLMVLTGLLLAIAPEFLYLRDNFGQRINTIFKFYYQAWALFGIAALFALDYLWRREKFLGKIAAAGYLAMFSVSLVYPFYGVQSRAREFAGSPTLNGMAHIQLFNPEEYEAILWLRDNAPTGSVVLEATGGQYSDYARVSANSGLPTLLGWLGHELQWRGYSNPEPGRRSPIISQLYQSTNWNERQRLLDEFEVDYIFVGGKERIDFGNDFTLFDEHLPVVFANNTVIIYRWQAANFAGRLN